MPRRRQSVAAQTETEELRNYAQAMEKHLRLLQQTGAVMVGLDRKPDIPSPQNGETIFDYKEKRLCTWFDGKWYCVGGLPSAFLYLHRDDASTEGWEWEYGHGFLTNDPEVFKWNDVDSGWHLGNEDHVNDPYFVGTRAGTYLVTVAFGMEFTNEIIGSASHPEEFVTRIGAVMGDSGQYLLEQYHWSTHERDLLIEAGAFIGSGPGGTEPFDRFTMYRQCTEQYVSCDWVSEEDPLAFLPLVMMMPTFNYPFADDEKLIDGLGGWMIVTWLSTLDRHCGEV